MKYEYKRILFENRNVEIISDVWFTVSRWMVWKLFSPYARIRVMTLLGQECNNRYPARNNHNHVRGISNEERREYHFPDRFFNNVPIDKDRDRL